MQTPTDKASLLAALKQGRAAWEALLARVDPARMADPGVEGFWSVREMLAHITAFEEYAAAYAEDLARYGRLPAAGVAALDAHYTALLAARRTAEPELPATLEQLHVDQLNVLFVDDQRRLPIAAVLERGRRAFDATYAALDRLDEALLTTPQVEFNNRSLLEIMPAQSYRHYTKHAVFIERWLVGGQ